MKENLPQHFMEKALKSSGVLNPERPLNKVALCLQRVFLEMTIKVYLINILSANQSLSTDELERQ